MYVSCHKEYVAIHEMGMKAKVPVQYAWVGRAGSLPPLPPAPLVELLGGGEGWRAGSSLGILSREGGISGKQAAS